MAIMGLIAAGLVAGGLLRYWQIGRRAVCELDRELQRIRKQEEEARRELREEKSKRYSLEDQMAIGNQELRAERRIQFERLEFENRVRAMAGDDPFWPQFMALLEAHIATETGPVAAPGLDDAEAHRLRGRVGMLLDFRNDMREVWQRTHPAPAQTGAN